MIVMTKFKIEINNVEYVAEDKDNARNYLSEKLENKVPVAEINNWLFMAENSSRGITAGKVKIIAEKGS